MELAPKSMPPIILNTTLGGLQSYSADQASAVKTTQEARNMQKGRSLYMSTRCAVRALQRGTEVHHILHTIKAC